LVNYTAYFKEVFIPYQTIINSKSDIRRLCEVYVCMHLCDESKDILNQTPGFCSDEPGNFEVVSDDEMSLRRTEFDKYKWYILRVASNYEEKVCQRVLENSMRLGVSDYFKEVFIPYEEPSEAALRPKTTVTRRKCFPIPWSRFLLVKLTGSQLITKFTPPPILWILKVYKRPPPIHVLSQINPFHDLPYHS